jgi:hypothetical protein
MPCSNSSSGLQSEAQGAVVLLKRKPTILHSKLKKNGLEKECLIGTGLNLLGGGGMYWSNLLPAVHHFLEDDRSH